MEIITDINDSKKEIIDSIKRHGFANEHNFWYLYNQQTYHIRPHFFKFGNGCGIMSTRHESGVWEIIGEVLAPPEKRLEMFEYLLGYALISKKDKKVFTSVPESFVYTISSMFKQSTKYRITKPLLSYTPIFDMEKWDEKLNGRK